MTPETKSLFECVLNQDARGVARAISQKAALEGDRMALNDMHIVEKKNGSLRLCDCEDDDHDYEEGHFIRDRSPLLFAAMNGNIEIARLLLDAGADVDNFDDFGMSALHYAARRYKYSPGMVHFLVNRGAALDEYDGDGFTPVCYLEMSVKAAIAAASNFLEEVKSKSKYPEGCPGAFVINN